MIRVTVTELRNHLPAYIGKVKTGEKVAVTSHGKVVAMLVADKDECSAARSRLAAIRKASWIGDVVSSTGETWKVERDNS